jgi:predicted NUDIX family phosphoesterase
MKKELTLCLRSEFVRHVLDHRTGFIPRKDVDVDRLLDPTELHVIPRQHAELDETYLQLIPYAACEMDAEPPESVGSGTGVLSYSRSGSESRLYDMGSIGIGGHMSLLDLEFLEGVSGHHYLDLWHTVIRAARREIEEELGQSPSAIDFRGFIFDPSDRVGLVHLGIACKARIFARLGEMDLSDEISNPQVSDYAHVQETYNNLETWSQLFLDHLSTEATLFDGEEASAE